MRARWLMPAALAATQIVQVAHATQYMSVAEAQRAAFPAASSFVALPPPDAAAAAAVGAAAGWAPEIFEARSGDARLGWIIVDRVIGKAELITYSLAIDAGGAVSALEVLDYRETHGGEIRLPAWRKQFVGKTARDPVHVDSDIRNISGATLSSRHVTDGAHRLLQYCEHALRGAG